MIATNIAGEEVTAIQRALDRRSEWNEETHSPEDRRQLEAAAKSFGAAEVERALAGVKAGEGQAARALAALYADATAAPNVAPKQTDTGGG